MLSARDLKLKRIGYGVQVSKFARPPRREAPAPVTDGNTLVAVGDAGIVYSLDGGLSWLAANIASAFPSNIRDVKYGNGVFIAVGEGDGVLLNSIVRSTDGINWTVASGLGFHFGNAAYAVANDASNTWVAVGTTPNPVIRSNDNGLTWTASTLANGLTNAFAVAWTGSQWVVGGTGTSPIQWATRTAATFSASTGAGVSGLLGVDCITVVGGTILVGGYTNTVNTSGGSILSVSTNNGTSFTRAMDRGTITTKRVRSIAYLQGVGWIAAGESANRGFAWYHPDAGGVPTNSPGWQDVDFTSLNNPGENWRLSRVFAANGLFVATANSVRCLYSSDGTTWNTNVDSSGLFGYGILYANGKWFVGADGIRYGATPVVLAQGTGSTPGNTIYAFASRLP